MKIKINWQKIQHYLPLSIILLIGFTLRIIVLFRQGDFVWDELFSVNFSQMPWTSSWYYWLLETNPPLHMIALKFWFYLLPITEWSARLFSLIVGSATLVLYYFFCKKITSEKTALLATLFLSLSSVNISASSLARGYSLLSFLALVSNYLFINIFFDSNNTKKQTMGYILINFFLLFTHLTSCLVFLAQLLTVFFLNRRATKKIIIYWLLPLSFWIIWVSSSFILKSYSPPIISAWFFSISLTFSNFLISISNLLIGHTSNLQSIIIGIISLFSIFGGIYGIIKKKITSKFVFVILLALIPLIFSFALGTLSNKFYWLSQLPLILVIAWFIENLLPVKLRWISFIYIIILCIPSIGRLLLLPQNISFTPVSDFVLKYGSTDKKQLLFSNHFIDELTFKYYPKNLPIEKLVYSSSPYYPPDNTEIILNNYYYPDHSEEEKAIWWKLFHPEKYDQIFLLEEKYARFDLSSIFIAHGWKLIAKEKLEHVPMKREIFLFERPTNISK